MKKLIGAINSFNPEWYKPKETKMNRIYELDIIERIARTVRVNAKTFGEAEAIVSGVPNNDGIEYMTHEEQLKSEVMSITLIEH